MTAGPAATFRYLAASDDEAAGRALRAALDSPLPSIRHQALAAILERHDPAGHREYLRRVDPIEPLWRTVLLDHPEKIGRTLRDVMLGDDPQLVRAACLAAGWLRDYDLAPTILVALEEPEHPLADLLGHTILDLVSRLCHELAAPSSPGQHAASLARRRLVAALEASVQRFGRHQRREPLEAFVLLAYRDDVTLRQILENPHHSAFAATKELLMRTRQAGAMRLTVGYLDDPHAPLGAISIVSRRTDARFLECLMRKVGREPSATVARHLAQIRSFAWARDGGRVLDSLDDHGQHAAVRLLMASGAAGSQALPVLERLLEYGKPGGRRAAIAALTAFSGPVANRLVMMAAEDSDAEVQAAALAQFHERNLPGAMARLIDALESPHSVVRRTARKGLAQFAFPQFFANFDLLDEPTRRQTAALVKKVDPQTPAQLRAELHSPIRSHRLRALAILPCLELIAELEDAVIALLADEDPVVRAEAVAVLGDCPTPRVREALREAMNDPVRLVQQAVCRALDIDEASLALRGGQPETAEVVG